MGNVESHFIVVEVDRCRLSEYKSIRNTLAVSSEFNVIEESSGQIHLVEQRLAKSYTKDYDSHPNNFDDCILFLAYDRFGTLVGGAALDPRTCSLVDLRIKWIWRRHGVGQALFQHIVKYVREHKTEKLLKIETQNVNVSACRFCETMGARLGAIDSTAYKQHKGIEHEIKLIYYFDL